MWIPNGLPETLTRSKQLPFWLRWRGVKKVVSKVLIAQYRVNLDLLPKTAKKDMVNWHPLWLIQRWEEDVQELNWVISSCVLQGRTSNVVEPHNPQRVMR